MKYLPLIYIAVLLSCTGSKNLKITPVAVAANSADTATYRPFGQPSIFRFESKKRLIDKIQVRLIKPENGKANDTTQYFALDFYRNGKRFQTVQVSTYFSGEEKIWQASENYFTDEKAGETDNRFFACYAGVPACGYGLDEFLFFVNGDNVELFDRSTTAGEESYSSGKHFFPRFDANKITSVISRYEDMEVTYPDSLDTVQKIKTVYSDSTLYRFVNAKWKLKTIKKGIYRTEIKDQPIEQTEE